LHVPGMTEFKLEDGHVLGLMPIGGAAKLLGAAIFKSQSVEPPKAELYLLVDDASIYLERAVQNGARLLLTVDVRDWGDRVGYCLDNDGHVLAFAEPI